MSRVNNLRIRLLKALSEAFQQSSFFVQGHMDIDERSPWFEPEFNKLHGGFFPPKAEQRRKRSSLPMHDHVRNDMLTLLCRSITERKVTGSIAELGVYQGATARLFHHYMPERKLFLLDTFEGFDQKDVTHEEQSTGVKTTETHFADTSTQIVLKHIAPQNSSVILVPGYFPDSATAELRSESFALVHLDADLYQPTLAGLQFFYPKLSPGGMLAVHDYNAWLGARKAVDEYCAEQNLIPIPMPDKSGSCLLVKGA